MPLYNSERHWPSAIDSVLAQTYPDLEIIISDNASTDRTEELCRQVARDDDRVRYCRQPSNRGLVRNFDFTLKAARGELFCWIGHDDRFEPTFVERCVEAFAADDRLTLVSSDINWIFPDGVIRRSWYHGSSMHSDDPVDRFTDMLVSFHQSELGFDPLASMMRRQHVVGLARGNMLGEDEVFAAQMALVGPWGHVPEPLLNRTISTDTFDDLVRLLGLPHWHIHVRVARKHWEWIHAVNRGPLDAAQRRRARAAVIRNYVSWHRHRIGRVGRRLGRRVRPSADG
jgi:glycosyltransferase involved in cell wall biosynthesis